jgi:SAM-dependent MidA family methyltransferase
VSGLRAVIEGEIRERGPIPFSRYMESCLYHPQFGYYSRSAEQFGKAGDFYTSSDVHAVFGRLLARQFEEMWRALGSPERIVIKELGPGRGLFAQDVIDWAEKKFTDFFRALRYELVEQSPALRQRIAGTLQRRFESGQVAFGSLEQHPDCPVIVFANEFFDAIPVEVVSARGSLRIDAREGRFVESWAAVSPQELQYLDRYSVRPEEAVRLELPLQSQELISEAVGFDRGFVVVVDYGYTRQEQLAGRHRGTIKAIRQHSVSGTPYEAPGEQDITADVNFTALAAAVQQQGFRAEKLVTQSQFLMGIGEDTQFADAFEDCRLPQERAKVALQLKHLVTPAGMGESFHVLVASKGAAEEELQQLSGLSFGRRHLRGG